MEWEQSGRIMAPHCFPGEAEVTTREGRKFMESLQTGDEVLGFDHATGTIVYTPVWGWLHRKPFAVGTMIAIGTTCGSLVLSATHLLAVTEKTIGRSRYMFAVEVKVHDLLVGLDGSTVEVTRLSITEAKGFYAPGTGTSNLFVAGAGMDQSLLAHNLAGVRNPRLYEIALSLSVAVFSWIWPGDGLDENSVPSYEHPAIPRRWIWSSGENLSVRRLFTGKTAQPNGLLRQLRRVAEPAKQIGNSATNPKLTECVNINFDATDEIPAAFSSLVTMPVFVQAGWKPDNPENITDWKRPLPLFPEFDNWVYVSQNQRWIGFVVFSMAFGGFAFATSRQNLAKTRPSSINHVQGEPTSEHQYSDVPPEMHHTLDAEDDG